MKEELKEWLKESGKDRAWLARECGVSKRTVDGWFTKGMPKVAQELVRRIMEENSFGELQMNYDDWKIVNRAMSQSGYNDFNEFVIDVIKSYAAESKGSYNLKAIKKSLRQSG